MNLESKSYEELWELFPILFTDNKENFKEIYFEEEKLLRSMLEGFILRISHIGSTSIPNIKTKPIVDILIEIDFEKKEKVKEILKKKYILMNETSSKISFNKGYTLSGYAKKVIHIHIKNYGDCDELYFRDYLKDNERKAKEYEKLKLALFNKYKPNRDLYTEGKTEFVEKIVKLAKKEYKNRYEQSRGFNRKD